MTATATPLSPLRHLRPASPVWGWLACVLFCVAGVPIFLRMPPWCDLTLYQVAASSVAHGGVLYRDVFDTNLPGFVAALRLVRALAGPSAEAARLADLGFVLAASVLLVRWARRGGALPGSVAWLCAGGCGFYLFTSEFNHAQRDVWMMAPAIGAAMLRVRRLQAGASASRPLLSALLEGLAWGCAVWVKPHAIVVAAAVALVTLRRDGLARTAACVAGGLIAAAAGVITLKVTGAWADFWEVMTVWNPAYTRRTLAELPERRWTTFIYFPPWSLLHLAAAPLAVWHAARLIGPARWGEGGQGVARGTLAAMYLGWAGQALVLQRGAHYVHVPEIFLMLALGAATRWPFAQVCLGWVAFLAIGLNLAPDAAEHWPEALRETLPPEKPPFADAAVMRRWPDCFRGGSPELRDALAQYKHVHCCANWVDLGRVGDYLRAVEPPLRDGELTAFHDSPHPLYLDLDVAPSTRFMHFGTVLAIEGRAGQIGDEVRASRQRYVVSDLMRMTWNPAEVHAPGYGGDPRRLPGWFPVSQLGLYPWNQPIVFRSGRYCVHEITEPVGPVTVPDWDTLDQLGPGRP